MGVKTMGVNMRRRTVVALLSVILPIGISLQTVEGQGQRPAEISAQNAKAIPPIKMFDDLYYVGIDYVSAYVVKTSAGLIMVDTLYDKWVDHGIEAIRELGLDPKDIKYIVVTHGHNDHFGGAKAVQTLSGARVMMTEEDWKLMERSAARNPDSVVSRDIVIKDGDTLKLGETIFKFYITPGHTPGVASMEFPVHDGGKQYKAFLFGGHNVTSNQIPAFEMMITSVKRLMSTLSGVDVNLTSHPWAALILERGEKMKAGKSQNLNPYVAPEEFKAFLRERLTDAETRLAAAKLAEAKKAAGQ